MLKSSAAVAAATMASRLLGLVREVVYARFMGAGWVADAFTLAYMVPNLFRRLLGEGALTAAFIPIFKQTEKQDGKEATWKAANAVLCGLALLLLGLVLVGLAGVTLVLQLPVFEGKTRLMLELLRVMFPYVLLVCVAALFTGILNARGHFFVPALGSLLLNIVLIGAVLWGAPRMGLELHEQIFGLALGVLAAGVAQAVFQWPLLRSEGFRLRWVTPWSHPVVRRVLQRMIPGIMGVAAYQINVLVTNGIAFHVDNAVVASFNYAVRLMEFPQGVFGLSLASYLLPTLAGLAAAKDYPEFRKTLQNGLGYLVLLNLLAGVLLMVLAEPIVRLLFERGRFDAADTARAARALTCLAPGLVAFSAVNILARAFYALGDLRTPVRISMLCLTLNVLVVLALIWRFKEAGMGMANSATAILNAGLLAYALKRKLSGLDWRPWRRLAPAMLGATLLAGVAAWWLRGRTDWWLGHEGFWARGAGVFLPALAATLVYGVSAHWLRVPYVNELCRLMIGKSR